jgi:hypothetical protein
MLSYTYLLEDPHKAELNSLISTTFRTTSTIRIPYPPETADLENNPQVRGGRSQEGIGERPLGNSNKRSNIR